jgi:hypothetical protein
MSITRTSCAYCTHGKRYKTVGAYNIICQHPEDDTSRTGWDSLRTPWGKCSQFAPRIAKTAGGTA